MSIDFGGGPDDCLEVDVGRSSSISCSFSISGVLIMKMISNANPKSINAVTLSSEFASRDFFLWKDLGIEHTLSALKFDHIR